MFTSFRKNYTAIIGGLTVPFILAACGMPVVVPGENSSAYSYSGTSAALDGRQTAVVVHGNPFPGVETSALLPVIAQSMENSAGMIDTQFVPIPENAARPEYSVVLAFNTVGNINPSTLCSEAEPIRTDPNRRPIQLQAAFCGRGPVSTSTGWLGEAEGPNDSQFQNLVYSVSATLFPTGDDSSDTSSDSSSSSSGSSSSSDSSSSSSDSLTSTP